MADHTPQFFFQINRIRQNPDIRSIRNSMGMWFPPKALYGSIVRQGQTTYKIFHFDGDRVHEVENVPRDATLWRTTSMYHSEGNFFMVPYDCTQYQVASGRPNDDEHNSSEDEDAEGEEDEEGPDVNSIDWSVLRFHWQPIGYLSEAWCGSTQPRLNTQRPNQQWVANLLPATYKAEFGRRTDDPLYGGLNGDLSILIGLLAFSCYDGAVEEVILQCIRAVHGNHPQGGWRMHTRSLEEGWVDRRGFCIRVWSWPPYSTNENLNSMERGQLGKPIFR